ncbi:hypothetical protein IE81DRAFT_321578 [Ceraceosorus guamensis]|uniref:Uncharacterized protein n=1 Tax=Ceraceosorus guamensis TaxID=1522189 RepID=A0A316W8Z5_9BASI|nr:hypothetical protein IE81DRAFT_321578 [Ceraceosorus guamensis]PWN44175.1 hypothetical protein IE81DRAFT_321578 [Ceraceosorus guamensis]
MVLEEYEDGMVLMEGGEAKPHRKTHLGKAKSKSPPKHQSTRSRTQEGMPNRCMCLA